MVSKGLYLGGLSILADYVLVIIGPIDDEEENALLMIGR
jgi:hypothetical protein